MTRSSNRYGMDIMRGVWTAQTPLHHGGNEKTGSVSLLNRQRYITDDGPADIPIISGNAIRGYLRRLVMSDFLYEVGYTLDLDKPKERKLYHALFTGGVLEQVDKKEKGIINLELKRRLYDTIPFIRLWGFAWGNQMIESILKVGQAIPICTELSDYLPPSTEYTPKHTVFSLISQTYQTRKDDLSGMRHEDEAVHQMLVDFEVFIPGTKFYHDFRLEDATDLDRSAFATALDIWRSKPYVGARSGTGMGRINFDYELPPNVDNTVYDAFVVENKSNIISLLDELCGR